MRPAWAPAWLLWIAALTVMICAPRMARASDASTDAEKSNVELYRIASSAVVRVNVAIEDLDENGKPRTVRLVMSGFFISREGRVLTNSAAQATRVWIEKDGLSYLAESIGSDPRTNIGLLQAVKLPEKFEIISVPSPDAPPPIGSGVLAVTSPLEFDPSPSPGIVTGYESSFSTFVFPFTYMRVNIPGGKGEGGSPMLDSYGKLAGIIVASLPDVRSSYAVPARALARIVEDLSANGRVVYGSLPVEFAEGPDKQNVARQVVVSSVVPDSSSARAGLRPGDIVRRLGSTVVRRVDDVRDALFFAHVGQFLVMEVEREGRRMEFALQVEARVEAPAPPAGTTTPPPPAPATNPNRGG